jgi:hypothetical protein
VLGALLAIPTAASLGVIVDELIFVNRSGAPESGVPEPAD